MFEEYIEERNKELPKILQVTTKSGTFDVTNEGIVIRYNEKLKNFQMFYNDENVKRIIWECVTDKKVISSRVDNFLKMYKDKNRLFECGQCNINRIKERNKLEKIRNMTEFIDSKKYHIVEVRTKDGKWHKVTENNFKIGYIELRKGQKTLQIVYNEELIEKVKYECMDCKNPIETNWKGLKKYFNKTHLLRCNKCWHNRPEIKEKIKETAKKNREKKGKIERKKIITRHLKEPKRLKKRIDKTRQSLLTSSNKVNTLVRAYSTNYINLDIEWEYPFTEDIPKLERNKFFQVALFADLAIPSLKKVIEILGEYYHKGFISYFFDGENLDDLLKNNNEFYIQQLKDDIKRDEYYKKIGWDVLYIREFDLDKPGWQEMIDNFIKSRIIKR